MSQQDVDIHREFFELKGKFESLCSSVEKLTERVEQLTDVLNQAKGAKYVVFLIPAILGGLIGIMSYFGIKASVGP